MSASNPSRPAPGEPAPSGLPGRILHWLRQAFSGEGRRARLPIAGLPDGVGEVPPGEAALLLYADAESRDRLLLALLGSALTRRRVTWLCAPEKLPAGVAPDMRAAALSLQLHPLSWTGEAVGQLRQLGAAHLVREMAASGMQDHDLLVIDAFDPWLCETPDDVALEANVTEALHGLVRWAKGHGGPVIALAPATHRGQSLLPLVAGAGIARMASFRADASTAQLEILRWGPARRAESRNAPARYDLTASAASVSADHQWRCETSSPLDTAARLEAEDAATVHAVRGAVVDASEIPSGWRIHASTEALVAAARDAVCATVVLAHDHPDAIAPLADAVFRLRKEHPHLLKIVVRQTDSILRRNGELALLRLGANVVVAQDQGFAQLADRIEQLAGQLYALPQAVSASRALQTVAPDPIQGYLPPLEFCTAVERMLERTAQMPLEHSLVLMPLLPHVPHLDALLACNPRRDGDVVSADARGISIFLFGCAASDVMAALDSLFAIPCSELAQRVQIETGTSSQRQALMRLRSAAEASPADYSAILRGVAPGRRLAPIQAAILPTRSAEAARQVHAHILPLRTATV